MSALAWWLASIAYALAGLCVGCRIATFLAWHFLEGARRSYPSMTRGQRAPGGDHWAGGMALGLCVGCVWPLAVAAFTFRGVLFAPPRDVRVQRQAEEIKRLERELELAG